MTDETSSNESPSSPANKVVLAVDSQVLSKIQSCNQRAAYSHVDNIEPIDYENTALEKGLVLHEGLAEYYANRHKVEYLILKARVIARMESYAPLKTDLAQADINNCIDAMNSYMQQYQTETLKPYFVDGEPLVEKTFAVPLYEDEELLILLTGVTDLIADWNNGRYPVDHKSYSSWFKPAIMSNQFHGYCFATQSNSLLVNRIGLGRKTGENERVVVSYTDGELEEWKKNTIYEIRAHYAMMQKGWYRRNFEACEEYGGCRYKMLCNAKPELRDTLIKVNYKVVPEWDPMDRS